MKAFIILLTVYLLISPSDSDNIAQEQSERPNIIFIIADDMTRNMFNFLPEGKGKNLTPALDRLADEGVIMMGQHVCSTVCTPSRFNVLSGKYASRANNPEFIKQAKKNEGQRVVEWNTHIIPGEPGLPVLLKKAGYRTGAVGKNHVFEVEGYVEVPLTADASKPGVMRQQKLNYKKTIDAYHKSGFDYAGGIFYENPDFNGPRSLAVHNLDWTTEAALDFIDSNDKRPFFLYFATTLPHGPQDADRAWNADRRITPIGVMDHEPEVLPEKSSIPERLRKAGINMSDPKANLLWMDDAITALLIRLEESKQLDNTIIFFFNDHGQYGKGSIYQGATVNPSVVWKKGGFEADHICLSTVQNVDFVPTILDLAGIRYDVAEFDGRSFAPLLNGDKTIQRESLYFEIGYSRGVRKGKYKYIALRYPDWVENLTPDERREILEDYNKKLAVRGKKPNNLDWMAPFGHVQIIPGGGDAEYPASKRYPNYSDRDQLYDLEADPGEQVNLFNSPGYEAIAREMQFELKKYLKNIPGKFGEFKND